MRHQFELPKCLLLLKIAKRCYPKNLIENLLISHCCGVTSRTKFFISVACNKNHLVKMSSHYQFAKCDLHMSKIFCAMTFSFFKWELEKL